MKKNTLSAILMTLFLFISCNNSGKDGNTSANSADESVKGPNLTEISKKITESNAVVLAVKEVEALLSSIDELAKAIGKEIGANGLVNQANHNVSLLAGAYEISTLITEKLSKLNGSEGLKEKIAAAKKCSEEFSTKLKSSNAQLNQANANDANAKAAILKTHNTKDKGAEELVKLAESVAGLLKVAQETLNNSVKELTSPVVAENPKKP
ncbi:cell surface protein [Borreliella burgdorferi]|nr:Vsp/OspC family lipoprotein [Borreliella burgdorferi]MCD2318905.1 cell surface protein [Borreliella burgdorferi]MCD2376735.1 cell surface protein [Borreliella burgdorferi]MCD2377240.1 cell surface protein [Borreliella burgdorferi]MCD2388420.1 cell surface protein [Borreliella burgdorferi]MCD2392364.1 cell surface protein [Borreliella burgdorferi]